MLTARPERTQSYCQADHPKPTSSNLRGPFCFVTPHQSTKRAAAGSKEGKEYQAQQVNFVGRDYRDREANEV